MPQDTMPRRLTKAHPQKLCAESWHIGRDILQDAWVFDLHVDLILQQRLFRRDHRRRHRAGFPGQPWFNH
ncbi:MAG: hypothetical protein AAGJ35_09065, partial [Myxococcota bacterium]